MLMVFRDIIAFSLLITICCTALTPAPAEEEPPQKRHASRGATQNPQKKQPPAAPLRLPPAVVRRDPNRSHSLLPGEYLPTSQLKPGMRGYGLTVLRGNKIERFEVRILGVVRKANNGRDLILVRLGGPNLTRVTDVIAGMSGSPVYVNGKIVGAVAYGSAFTRESIGYLTPIEDMLDAWNPALPQSPEEPEPATPVTPLEAPLTVDGRMYNRVQIVSDTRTAAKPGVLALKRLGTRVTISGVSGLRFARVAEELAKWGLEARQGSGAAVAGVKGSPLLPGGAIAMSLATGDIDITGIGTLTYRRGDRVVAFGHPFLGIGPVQAPMYTAYIHDIEPSFNESHKIGSPVSLVGTFLQDRPFSIGGRIGPKPAMMPVTVRINDRMMGHSRTFRAELMRHPLLLPTLANLAVGSAINEVHGQPGDAMASVQMEVETEGFGTVRRSNRVYDPAALDEAVSGELRGLLSVLGNNSFQRVGVRSLRLDVTIDRGRETAQIERIFLKQGRFEPGETVEVGVILKPYKREPILRTLRVTIPPGTPSGTLLLTVQGGATGFAQSSGLMAMLAGRGPDYSTAATVPQILRKFEERERNDALVARLSLPSSSILIRGEKMQGLPPHLETALRQGAARTSGARLERDEVKVTEPTPFVLSGLHTLALRIAKKGQPDAGGPPPAVSSPPAIASGSAGTGTNDRPPGSPEAEGVNNTLLRGDERAEMSLNPEILPAVPAVLAEAQPPTPVTLVAPPPATPGTAGATPVSDSPVRAVGRQPGLWRQSTVADFRAGVRDGIAVTGQGALQLAPRLIRVAETVDPYFWCLASDGQGGVFAGSGDNGVIYHLKDGQKAVPFARTGDAQVLALARDADGTLYAGTAPEGRILKIGRDGTVTTLFDAPEKFVLALVPDGKGHLLAAVGGPRARVYQVDPQRKSEPVTRYASDEDSVTALTCGTDGAIYAGTAPGGLVLRLAEPPGAAPTVLYDAPEPGIASLIVRSPEVVLVATAPRGVVYRIAPSAPTRVLYEKPPGGTISSMTRGADGTLYLASGASIIAIDPEKPEMVRTYEVPTDIQINTLLTDGTRLWAATGSVAGVYCLQEAGGESRGEYVSSVFDARAVVRWGTIRWQAELPGSSALAVQTRTGDTAEPDSTWSDWSGSYGIASGEKITSPSSRYLQYRLFMSGKGDGAPVLRSIEAFYLPPNQAPQVTLLLPRGGEIWRGTKTVRWNGTDADKDTLSYEALISSDQGKTWQKVPTGSKSGLKPASPTAKMPEEARIPVSATRSEEKQAPDSAGPAVSASAPGRTAKSVTPVESELAKFPEMSPEMRARILKDAVGAGSGAESSAEKTTGAIRETSLSLDTTLLPDGVYLLKIIGTDKPSNPTDAGTTEALSLAFRIVNRVPLLQMGESSVLVGADKTVRITGTASQQNAAIRAVQYRVDGGDWVAAVADDGIFDSLTEPFALVTATLTSGEHTLELQLLDEAGNTSTQKIPVKIP